MPAHGPWCTQVLLLGSWQHVHQARVKVVRTLSSQRSAVSGQRSAVSGQRSAVSGQRGDVADVCVCDCVSCALSAGVWHSSR